MKTQREVRMANELRKIQEDTPYEINVYQDPTNINHLIAVLRGPLNSSFENGYFVVDVVNPIGYPFAPPQIKFCTKVWHPNVSPETGKFCMDLLQDKWSPALYLEKTLLLVQSLIASPMLVSPADAVNPAAAEMFLTNPTMFQKTAREWTERYAASSPQSPDLVAQWLRQPPFLDGAARVFNSLLTALSTGVGNFTDPVLVPPSEAVEAPLPQVPPPVVAPAAAPASTESAPSPVALPPVPPPVLDIPLNPISSSWLALLLEGRTTPAFITLCEQKLIFQEDFSSAELLAMVPENEFTCDYLTNIGITAKGLQMKLITLHRELREVHKIDFFRNDVAYPPIPAPVTSTFETARIYISERSNDGDRALDPPYVHVEPGYNNHARDNSNLDPCFVSSGVSTI